MEYAFFYVSIAIILVIFFIVLRFKTLEPKHLLIGAASVLYSLMFDLLLGRIIGLYYYISTEESVIYMVLSAIFIYAILNMLYTLFLPWRAIYTIFYTALWIAAMILFEYLSIRFGTVVFTGWQPIPWSLVTYMATYLWIYLLYRYLTRKACGR